MLVLTRKLQQQIKIGEQITVTILKVKGSTVRIGVQAPREVRVVRGELPKENASAEATVAERPAPEAVATAGDEVPAGTESALEEAVTPVNAPTVARPAPPISAGHLPLRRIRNRYGAAPLKQVIASCATLAK